jgi:hypothetical protein
MSRDCGVVWGCVAFLRAEGVLLENRNQVLTKLNNEVKVRRSTRSVVLGKAKVMSYEDIEEARKKRAAKDAKKGKGKRGRKRKSAALEADEPKETSQWQTRKSQSQS